MIKEYLRKLWEDEMPNWMVILLLLFLLSVVIIFKGLAYLFFKWIFG